MLIVGLIMVGVLYWAARSGQFDDLEGDAHRILMDEDLRPEHKDAAHKQDAGPEDKQPAPEDDEHP
jgi:cbb3-type cytochrome oxidase maturation protein